MKLDPIRSTKPYSAHGDYEEGVDPPLAPCPFCRSDDLECSNTHSPFYSVECLNCEAQGPKGRPDNEPKNGKYRSAKAYEAAHRSAFANAIALWNRGRNDGA